MQNEGCRNKKGRLKFFFILSGVFRSRFWKSSGAIFLSSLFILHSAFLCGCTRREPPADITIINNVEPESLDPAIITGQADGRVVQGLFAGLTRLDPKTARPGPDLAERWEISPDGLAY